MRYGLAGIVHDLVRVWGFSLFGLPCVPDMAAIATLKPVERLTFGFLFVDSALAASGAKPRGDGH